MDFAQSESGDIIAETIGRFAVDELRPRLREFEAARSVSKAVRDSYAMLGFEGFDLPEDAGGAGLGMLSRIRTNRLLAEARLVSDRAMARLFCWQN